MGDGKSRSSRSEEKAKAATRIQPEVLQDCDTKRRLANETKGIGMMRDIDENTKADALLMEHYFWQKSYREKLGYGSAAPECRQSRSSRQWDSTAEIVDEAVTHLEMEAVDWCMDAVTPECRQAIGKEMKNREAGAQVWRSPSTVSYPEAVAMIKPLMRKKDLI